MHKNPTAAEIILREDMEKKWPGKVFAEWGFHDVRKFRLDFAVPSQRIAFEINGGLFIKGKTGSGGAHSLPTSILRDMEKRNLATLLKWQIFEFTPQQVERGQHLAILSKL
jgi:hypothetical protein